MRDRQQLDIKSEPVDLHAAEYFFRRHVLKGLETALGVPDLSKEKYPDQKIS